MITSLPRIHDWRQRGYVGLAAMTVFLAAVAEGQQPRRQAGRPRASPTVTRPIQVGEPRTWLDTAGDARRAEDAHLYVASLWENRGVEQVRLTVQYTPYLPDGRALPGCSWGGTSADILPGERAWLSCSPIILRKDTAPVTATVRVEWVTVFPIHEANAQIDSANMGVGAAGERPFQPVAWVRALGADQKVTVVFRYYDSTDAQLATCESWTAVIQREVATQIEGSACPWRTPLPEAPVRMRTQVIAHGMH